MNKLTFYEQTGIVIPGSIFVFGLILLLPDLRAVFGKDEISIGGLGLFVLVAYAAGHLLAAIGNLLESVIWKVRGGMPSDWVTHQNPKVLNEQQVIRVAERIRERYRLEIGEIRGMPRRDWAPFFGQIYRDVLAHHPGRLEAFNGNYGLNRGLAAAMLSLAVASAVIEPCRWRLSLSLVAAAIVYAYRMHRFAVHFGREVYHGFLNLPADHADGA